MEAFLKCWVYLCVAIAGLAGGWVAAKWRALPAAKRLSWLFVAFLGVHILEEYVMPGGFWWAFGTAAGSANPLAAPLNQLTVMITNLGAMLAFCLLAWKWGERPFMMLAIVIFSLAQFGIHLAFGIVSMNACDWMSVPYSPGLANTVFMLLPLSIACIVRMRKDRMLSGLGAKKAAAQVAIALVTCALVVGGLIGIPVRLFGNDLNTPYAFEDAGLYQCEIE